MLHGFAAERALQELGYAYDYFSGPPWTGIDFSPYDIVLVGMDGGTAEVVDVQKLRTDILDAGKRQRPSERLALPGGHDGGHPRQDGCRKRMQRHVVGDDGRAVERAEEREVAVWQLVAGLEEAKLERERPASKPHPSIVVREELADGTEVEVIWAWLPESHRAMLVTVYFPE